MTVGNSRPYSVLGAVWTSGDRSEETVTGWNYSPYDTFFDVDISSDCGLLLDLEVEFHLLLC